MAFQQLYQNDPRWKDKKIGTGNHTFTISAVGCMLTSMTMILNYYGANETPASLNDKLVAGGGFNGAWIKSASAPAYFPQLGVKRQKRVRCADAQTPAPLELIDAGLEAGSLIMVQVDWQPDPDVDSHWVIIHAKKGDDYLIWDPWKNENKPDTLTGRYGFGVKKPADIILDVIWHGRGDFDPDAAAPPPKAKPTKPRTSKPAPRQPETPATSASVAVQPTVNNLTFRRQPQINSRNIIKQLPGAPVLTALEEAESVKGKIGQYHQWLHVQDSTGDKGYIAAWFAKLVATQPETPEPTTTQPTAPTALRVKTTVDSLSFRTEPRIGQETLIRYLPKASELEVIAAGDAANIGQQGKWIQVKAADGKKGFVAAWLVRR